MIIDNDTLTLVCRKLLTKGSLQNKKRVKLVTLSLLGPKPTLPTQLVT